MKFAKLFDTRVGQVLMVNTVCADTGNPEIAIHFFVDGVGICTWSITEPDDSKESFVEAKRKFETFTDDDFLPKIDYILNLGNSV